MATNVAQGLKATREGNTAALEQSIAAAQKGLAGMQTAANTRQTVQQTQQQAELFPGVKTLQGQQVRTGEVLTKEKELSFSDVEKARKYAFDATGEDVPWEVAAGILGAYKKTKLLEERGTPEAIKAEAGMIKAGVGAQTEQSKLAGAKAITEQGLETGRGDALKFEQEAKASIAQNQRIVADLVRDSGIPEAQAQFTLDNIGLEQKTKLLSAQASLNSSLASMTAAGAAKAKQAFIEAQAKLLDAALAKKGIGPEARALIEFSNKTGIELTKDQYERHEATLLGMIKNILDTGTIESMEAAVAKTATDFKLSSASASRLFSIGTGTTPTSAPLTTKQRAELAGMITQKLGQMRIDRNKLAWATQRPIPTMPDAFLPKKGVGQPKPEPSAGAATGFGTTTQPATPPSSSPGVTTDESVDDMIDRIMGL